MPSRNDSGDMNAFRRFKVLDSMLTSPHGVFLQLKNENPAGFKRLSKLVKRGYRGLPSQSAALLSEYESLKKSVVAEMRSKKRTRSRSSSRPSKRTRRN
jgi:hypothetical protein